MNLDIYKERFERQLPKFIEQMGENGVLKEACAYALKSGGKRLRPILVLMIGEALGNLDVMPAAFSAECFHTASLIADDLPCMDNDAMRRGLPTTHIAFGETAAVLASFTLMGAGYGGIHENGKKMALDGEKRAMICLGEAVRCAGLNGATQGQFLDLCPPDLKLETMQNIIYKKTVTLFEISFVFGWVFGGGDLEKITELKKCAYHLGTAFQIADDLDDVTQAKGMNFALALGREKAISYLEQEIASLEKKLKELHIWSPSFEYIVNSLRPLHAF